MADKLKAAQMEMRGSPDFHGQERQAKAQFDARAFNATSLRYLANVLQEARGATAFISRENRPADLWETLKDRGTRDIVERALDLAANDPRIAEDLLSQRYVYLTEAGSPYHASNILKGYDRALESKDTNYWEALARIVASVSRAV